MGQTGKWAYVRVFLGFELFLKIAGLSFSFPLIRGAITICTKAAGFRYITKENLSQFLLSPLTLFFLLLFCLFFSLLFFYELCVVSLLFRMRQSGLPASFSHLFFGSLFRMGELIFQKGKGILLSFLSLLFVLFINLPTLLFLFLFLPQTEQTVRDVLHPSSLFFLILLLLFCFLFALVLCVGVLMPETESRASLPRTQKKYLWFLQKRVIRGLFLRGIGLFLIETFLYFIGVALFVFIASRLTEKSILPVLLLRIFPRFHFLCCMVFLSLNAVIYEAFIASLRARQGFHPHFSVREKAAAVCQKKHFVILISSFFLVLLVSFLGTFSFFRNIRLFFAEALEEVCITAHRGASAHSPENTEASISEAIRQLSDYVEIDVQLSKDLEPVLFHDRTLFKVNGSHREISSYTSEELALIDVGSRFSMEFAGEGIPTLREMFQKFGGEIGFHIELKNYADDELAERVTELICEYHLEESSVVSSVSPELLRRVKQANDTIKTGRILSLVYGDFYQSEEADFYSIYYGFVSEKLVELSHAAGKEIHVWTVNSVPVVKRLKAIGVDNLITDYPQQTREALYDEKMAETVSDWISFLLPKK